ncbi:MAG: ribonucleotide-diphosphate reductase subunit beta [Robiginitomaculum sp.]|nr:ribonucleotide-diphosphate reductase subunit beta [Robiginitomaculum sp.]
MAHSDLLASRDNYKPFHYPMCFERYVAAQNMHWLPSEVPLSDDVDDWNDKLNDAERELLTQLFRFFTQADTDIARAYLERYIPAFKHPEVRMMLSVIATAEANHMHAYSLLIDTIGMPETEYAAFQEYEEMSSKHEYMFSKKVSGLSEREDLALDMAVFSAFGEGMQLFSSFAILMNFQRLGKMKGMSTIIEWSIRDETYHVESMIELFHIFIAENPEIWTDDFKGHIYQACRDMVDLEDKFIDLAFKGGAVEGITPEETKTYIRFIADRRLAQLGLKPNYNIKENPFQWLDFIIGAPTHTNFFEQRSTEYSKEISGDWKTAFNYIEHINKSHTDKYPGGLLIVTGEDCVWCDLAKTKIDQQNITAQYVNSKTTYGVELLSRVAKNSVPQIFELHVKGESLRHIGGAEALITEMEESLHSNA